MCRMERGQRCCFMILLIMVAWLRRQRVITNDLKQKTFFKTTFVFITYWIGLPEPAIEQTRVLSHWNMADHLPSSVADRFVLNEIRVCFF